MDVDSLLNELPQHIVDTIFSKLPIRDIVRSSIMSNPWRNKWKLVTNISIDDYVAKDYGEATAGDEIIDFVDEFWSMHVGPIDKLDIYTEFFYVTQEVERRWILTACQKGVKELTVEFNKAVFKAPPCLYLCEQLTRLELVDCELKQPPPDFSGFPCMKHLILKDIDIYGEDMELLISSCPLLESLTLVYFRCPELTIRAPKLRCLDLQGKFTCINLENTPLLGCMTLVQQFTLGFRKKKLFGSIPILERLCGDLTQSLSANAADPCKFINYKLLKHIELSGISFVDSKYVLVALRLIFSAPNLQELCIQGYCSWDEIEKEPCLDDFNDPILADRMMNRLELVEISHVNGPVFMKVVEFLLERSPSLVKMKIAPSSLFMDEERRRLISSFRRASQKVSIGIFEDRWMSSNTFVL